MNITEDLKSTLNKTLEIAIGIEKVNHMIDPSKGHTDGKNLVNEIYKEIQVLSQKSKNRDISARKTPTKPLIKPSTARIVTNTPSNKTNAKKNISISFKKINERVKMSRAGKRTVGKVLTDESLPFSQSFDRAVSSHGNTPAPKSLPFVSLTTGRTENPIKLPEFQEYLENKGSNYLKKLYNDDILTKFDHVSKKISSFREEFDLKASFYIKTLEGFTKRGSVLRKPTIKDTRMSSALKSRQGKSVPPNPNCKRSFQPGLNLTQPVFSGSIEGFNQAKLSQNQKFIDILSKIDLERPLMLKEKVNLIQKDNERFRNRLHSLKKFEKFRLTVEGNRRKRQNLNGKQGLAYMNVIEGFRLQRYKPNDGELELLQFWKRMVECGWVITKNDLEEVNESLKKRHSNSRCSDALLMKLMKAI